MKKDECDSHFITGEANYECVSLISENLHVIDTILHKYSQNKLKTCFEYNRNVFKLAISKLGINWKKEQNGIYYHESGFYDKNWILFNLHEIIWDSQDKSIGMLTFIRCDMICLHSS